MGHFLSADNFDDSLWDLHSLNGTGSCLAGGAEMGPQDIFAHNNPIAVLFCLPYCTEYTNFMTH